MLIFIIFYILVFLLSFKIKKGRFTLFDFLLILILVLFSGLRCVGLDYVLYKNIFYSSFSLESRTGIGFTYLMYFYKYIMHWDFQTLIFTISLVTNLCIYSFLKKNSERPGLAILIYVSLGFYTTSFNMFRQSLSIALVLLASQFLDEKKRIKTFLFYTVAFFIHSSSLIATISYLVAKYFKNKKIKLRYVLPIPIVILLFYDKIFYTIITFIDGYSIYSTYNTVPGIGTYINVSLYILFTLFFLIPKYKNNNEKNYQLYNLFLIGVSIMLIEFKNFLFFRIAFYFTILTPIILTRFYCEHNFKNRKLESLIFYLCLFGYFIIYINSFDGVLPYKFFFLN